MLKLMTDVTTLQQIGFQTGVGTLITSGLQGQWLVPGDTYAVYPTSGQAGAFQIWTEGNRDGSVGFTPDTTHTGKLTVLYGPYRARTDQFEGTLSEYAIGTKLTVSANGKLTPAVFVTVSGGALSASVTSNQIYAVCTGEGTMTYFQHNSGSAFDYIEYVTV